MGTEMFSTRNPDSHVATAAACSQAAIGKYFSMSPATTKGGSVG